MFQASSQTPTFPIVPRSHPPHPLTYFLLSTDAMWFMLQAAGAGDGLGRDAPYGFIVNKTNTALISEPEFPSRYYLPLVIVPIKL